MIVQQTGEGDAFNIYCVQARRFNREYRKENVASPKKTQGRCAGTIIQHWGMGLIILMALDSVTNFKILCYSPSINVVVHGRLYPSGFFFFGKSIEVSPPAVSAAC